MVVFYRILKSICHSKYQHTVEPDKSYEVNHKTFVHIDRYPQFYKDEVIDGERNFEENLSLQIPPFHTEPSHIPTLDALT